MAAATASKRMSTRTTAVMCTMDTRRKLATTALRRGRRTMRRPAISTATTTMVITATTATTATTVITITTGR